MEGIKINERVEIDQLGEVKQKDFFLVVMIKPTIIKQFEQMSASLKHLKMCPSTNVWFAEFCLKNDTVLVQKIFLPGQVKLIQYETNINSHIKHGNMLLKI